MKNWIYIIILQLLAASVAAQENYIIDSVCSGVSRTYQIIGEKGSTYEWYVKDNSGNIILNPPYTDIWVETSPGDTAWSSKIKVYWDNPGEYTIQTLHFSVHGCDTLEQGLVKVFPLPEAGAGNDMIVCVTEPVTLTTATAAHYSSLQWTTLGDGAFIDNTVINPVYIPGPGDNNTGKISLVLTVNGLAENETCVPATDTMEILFGNPVINFDSSGLLCFNNGSGWAKVNVTGGIAPYSYNWSGPGTFTSAADSIFGLVAGIYNVTVTDYIGCMVTGTVEIEEPDILISLITADKNILCEGETLQLTGQATGGIPDYSYQWSGEGAIYLSDNTVTTPLFENAPAGLFEIIFTTTDANGCKAADTLLITVNPAFSDTVQLAVCENELPYNWYGQLLNTKGFYSEKITDINGCDSILTVEFDYWPVYRDTVLLAVCENELPFEWHGRLLSVAGFYSDDLISKNGCDSVYVVNFDVLPVQRDTLTLTICASELPYEWNGLMLDAGGLYVEQRTNINGCDSVLYLDLKINPMPDLVLNNQNVCEPEKVDLTNPLVYAGSSPNLLFTYWLDTLTTQPLVGAENISQSGRYYVRAENSAGCFVVKGVDVNIEKAPVLVINNPGMICEPGIVDLTDASVTAGSGDNLIFTYWMEEEMLTAVSVPEKISMSGIYFIRAENAEGCFVIKPVTVTINNTPAAPVFTAIQPTCENAKGTIEVVSPLANGTTYSIDGINFQPETIFDNLSPGVYTITVKNTEGCTSSAETTIHPAANTPETPQLTVTQPDCGIPVGTIAVKSPLGAGLTYSIDGLNFQLEATFENLVPGDYSVIVKNSEGCISSADATIRPVLVVPEKPVLAVIQPGCDSPTGSIGVTSPTGTGITYSIDGINFQTETTFENLLPGGYSVTVKNIDGCTNNENATINPAPIIPENPVLAIKQPKCDVSTGEIEISAPVGAGLTYSIDGINYQVETKFENLIPGDYSVTVKNNNGCTSFMTATIIPATGSPDIPVLSLIQPDCTTPTGTIEVVSPLASGLLYSIDGINYQSETIFENLPPGDYTITVKNFDDCISSATGTIIPAAGTPEIPVLLVTMPGCETTTGTIEITGPTGAGLTYSIDGKNFSAATKFENLVPGEYTITVKNNDGCLNAVKETINPAPDTPDIPVLALSHPDCDIPTGSIEIVSPVGTGLSYSINNVDFQAETKFENLVPGDYTVYVKNTSDCISSVTGTVNPEPGKLAVSVTLTADRVEIEEGETVTFTAMPVNGGTNPVYAWYVNGDEVSGESLATFTLTPQNNDVVFVVLTSDLECVTDNPATSDEITIRYKDKQPVSVTIEADQVNVCEGGSVTFTATPVNGGASPVYAWFVNGKEIAGATSAIYSYYPQNGDNVYAILTSSLTYVTGNPATSNDITLAIRNDLPVSVTIAADNTAVCDKVPVTFAAKPVNGGPNPVYAWFVNGVEITGETSATFTYLPKNSDLVHAILISDLSCAYGNPATSNKIPIKVIDNATVSVTISSDKNNICSGEPVIFTALAANGGTDPVFAWYLNGVVVPGETSATFTMVPKDKDAVYTVLTSSLECTTDDKAFSNKITLNVMESVPVSVTVETDKDEICDGEIVTYTAVPVNGGANPVYEWYVNGVFIPGEDKPVFSYPPQKNDEIQVKLSSGLTGCLEGNPAVSDKIVVNVNEKLPVSVTLEANYSTVCINSPVTLTATAVNGGTNPVIKWFVNNLPVTGANSAAYTYNPQDGDEIYVVLESDLSCIDGSPAMSNKITINITDELPVGVSIVADKDNICEGEPVIFVATPVNGGDNPAFEWFVNGKTVQGETLAEFEYTPVKGDEVYVKVTSSLGCVSNNPATSNKLSINVNDKIPVSLVIVSDKTEICEGEIVSFSATSENGGSSPVYAWFVNGIEVAGAKNITYSFVPKDGDVVHATMASDLTCVTSNQAISNTIKISITNERAVGVSIVADKEVICAEETVTFTATPENGGTKPIFTWFVNGIKINGETEKTFRFKPKDGDVVHTMMESDLNCISGNPATSNSVKISVTDNAEVKITIGANSVFVCKNEPVNFTSSIENGGLNPVYSWYVNNVKVQGENSGSFTYVPNNKDEVYATLESDLICVAQKTGNSNKIAVTVGDITPPVAICQNVTVYLYADGKASVTAAQIDKGSFDNCGLDTLYLSRYNFACADTGKNLVTLTAVDLMGLTGSCVATVTVRDTVKPVIVCRGPFEIQLDENAHYTLTVGEVYQYGSDACGIDTMYVFPHKLDCDHIGLSTITLWAVGMNGDSAYCQAEVMIYGNRPPNVIDDSAFTFENVPVVIDIVENDFDEKTSIDISTLAISIKPLHGTVSVNPVNGEVTYTPNRNFSGIDVLQYRICDDGIPCEPECGTAYVYITVEPVNDKAEAGDDYYSAGCFSVTRNVLDNDKDPDSDNLYINTTPVVPPIHGELIIDPDGTISYFPNEGFIGIDSFQYVVCDNGSPQLCDSAWVYIDVDCSEETQNPLDCELFIPDGFSPNQDGIHDFFRIMCIHNYPNAKLMIFNRTGTLLWEKEHYGNYEYWGDQYNAWWWGTSVLSANDVGRYLINGEPRLKAGNYIYILQLGNGLVMNGTVMLWY